MIVSIRKQFREIVLRAPINLKFISSAAIIILYIQLFCSFLCLIDGKAYQIEIQFISIDSILYYYIGCRAHNFLEESTNENLSTAS